MYARYFGFCAKTQFIPAPDVVVVTDPAGIGIGANPGGQGKSANTVANFPFLCSLRASSYCLQILPNRRILEELPSSLAFASSCLYLANLCCKASSIELGGGGALKVAASGGGMSSGLSEIRAFVFMQKAIIKVA